MSEEPLEGEIIDDNGYVVRDNTLVAAGRWRRYAARVIDISVISFLGSLFLNATVGLVMAFVLDAVIYAIFKTTLGKWLFAEKVVDSATFQPISGTEYFKRNCWVCLSGFGLGIPLISFITLLRQFLRLGRGEAASYDQGNGWSVVVRDPSGIRTLIGVGVVVLMLLAIVIALFATIVAAVAMAAEN